MAAGLQAAIAEVERYYGPRLLAVALFGSRAGSRTRVDSDWDLLLVLDPADRIRRSLYREWDDRVAPIVEAVMPGISPHFVHLPPVGAAPSSLWLEVARTHEILSDQAGSLATHLERIGSAIQAGRFERRSVHGLPYWRSVP